MPIQEIVYPLRTSEVFKVIKIKIYQDGICFEAEGSGVNKAFYEDKTNKERYKKLRLNFADNKNLQALCDFLRQINLISPLGKEFIETIFSDLNITLPPKEQFNIIFPNIALKKTLLARDIYLAEH